MLHLTLLLASAPAPPGTIVAFDQDPAIRRFAERAVAGVEEHSARAHRIYDVILALKKDRSIHGDRDNSPKARPPKTAAELLAVSAREGEADRMAGCYELSALYVAAARSVGLEAVGVERVDPAGTGQIGHIMAGVRSKDSGRLTVFDLQNETRGSRVRIRELDDPEFAAHHYNHLAVAAFLNGELPAAYGSIQVALELAPESASFLNNRATILAAMKEPHLAVAEATHAVSLAPDVPLYRYQLGRLRMLTGDIAGAINALENALSLRPRYTLARRDLGWALLLANQPDAALRQLERAQREDPKTPEVSLYLGLLLLHRGDKARARSVAKTGLTRSKSDESLEALLALVDGKNGAAPAVERLRAVLKSVTSAQAAGQQ